MARYPGSNKNIKSKTALYNLKHHKNSLRHNDTTYNAFLPKNGQNNRNGSSRRQNTTKNYSR